MRILPVGLEGELMEREQVWVVGECFQSFAELDRVYTVSGLVRHLRELDPSAHDGGLAVRIGQGVGGYEREYLRSVIDRRGLGDRVYLAVPEVALARRDVVHKHRQSNVLLGDIRQVQLTGFVAALRLADENELLLDHQTGQHVQGMVVVETVRQMFLGVFETGYRHRWPLREYYVVWGRTKLDFQNFLFPLPAEVRCEVREARLSDPEKLEFEVVMDIEQGGRPVARAEVGFAAFDVVRIGPIERRRAVQALDAAFAVLAPVQPSTVEAVSAADRSQGIRVGVAR